MKILQHINQTRRLIAVAPLIGVGMLIVGALQGQTEMLLWRNYHIFPAVLSLLGQARIHAPGASP